MNLLAIDYGTKNIGLALVNTGIGVVLPFGKAKSEKRKVKNDELIKIIKREKIDKVVIGLPLGLDGKENENMRRARAFAKELAENANVEVELFDERFSSMQADAMGKGVSRDEKAAMVILEGYLEKNNFAMERTL